MSTHIFVFMLLSLVTVDACSCEPCLDKVLPLAVIVSFLAGMMLVLAPLIIFKLKRQRLCCFRERVEPVKGKWEGASTKVTDKVLREHTLERLNEIENQTDGANRPSKNTEDSKTLSTENDDVLSKANDNQDKKDNSEHQDSYDINPICDDNNKCNEKISTEDRHTESFEESLIDSLKESKTNELKTSGTADGVEKEDCKVDGGDEELARSDRKATCPDNDDDNADKFSDNNIDANAEENTEAKVDTGVVETIDTRGENGADNDENKGAVKEQATGSNGENWSKLPVRASGVEIYEHGRESTISDLDLSEMSGYVMLENENFRVSAITGSQNMLSKDVSTNL